MVRRRRIRDFALVTEALVLLFFSRLLILAQPLQKIVVRLGPVDRAQAKAGADLIADISWSLGAASARLPMRIACYERGIAACWMLRRRGFAAQFHYGVGTIDQKLAAHVWTTSGDLGVTGHEIAVQFRELAKS